jgi:dephospho-CoA kinase
VLKIGLTGGIGSGKSTVAAMLQSLGAVVIDTDALARSLTAPGGAAMPSIVAHFGPGVVASDGALDRVAMRALVFKDQTAKRQLESILHPMIAELTRDHAQQAQAAGARVLVFDVPLLVESGTWRARVDQVVVVDCAESTQLARVSARPGWSRDAAAQVVQQQASRAQRRAAADVVIDNDALSMDELRREVQALGSAWMTQEPSRPPVA